MGVLVKPEKGKSMRVLLADSHDQVRSALRLLLEQENSVEVVGETPSSAALLAEAAGVRPDVVLLEWSLIADRPNTVVAALRKQLPALRIIVLSSRPEARQAAVAAGIEQFVSKNAFSEELLAALRGPQAADRRPGHASRSAGSPTPDEA
jgi:DNA-binding NarL/FixJ family response regulator